METSDNSGGEEDFVIDEILAHRRFPVYKARIGHNLRFLTRWKGYSDEHNTWQLARDMNPDDAVFGAYLDKIGLTYEEACAVRYRVRSVAPSSVRKTKKKIGSSSKKSKSAVVGEESVIDTQSSTSSSLTSSFSSSGRSSQSLTETPICMGDKQPQFVSALDAHDLSQNQDVHEHKFDESSDAPPPSLQGMSVSCSGTLCELAHLDGNSTRFGFDLLLSSTGTSQCRNFTTVCRTIT